MPLIYVVLTVQSMSFAILSLLSNMKIFTNVLKACTDISCRNFIGCFKRIKNKEVVRASHSFQSVSTLFLSSLCTYIRAHASRLAVFLSPETEKRVASATGPTPDSATCTVIKWLEAQYFRQVMHTCLEFGCKEI